MATNTERLYLSTSPGVGGVLAAEAQALGLKVESSDGTGVTAVGPAGSHRRACLWLRTANHVLLRLAEGPVHSPEQLSALLSRAALAGVWDFRAPVSWQVTSRASRVGAREAAEALGAALGRPMDEGGLALQLRLDGNHATLSVDCSGEDLYKRGYRQELSRAPIRETLAAATLKLAGYDPALPFWDPMCGSGTLAIEAALISIRRAPGIARSFAFESFPTFDRPAWDRELALARTGERLEAAAPIRGTDIHAGSLGVARRNAKRAQVLDLLQLDRVDAKNVLRPPGTPGLILTNLPYGKRVNEQVDLRALYRGFGERLRKEFTGWTVAVLLEDEHLGKSLGLPPDRSFPLVNGGLHCALWLTHLGPRVA